jgi:tetratricopeptide (TPR) repeat protein
MGITTEQYEKIIRFLDAEMEVAEMEAFEKELAANPEMRHQLDFEQSLRDDFALQNLTSLPGTMASGKVREMRKWLAIGSAAAIIIALVLFTAPWKKPGPAPGIANQKNIDTAMEKRDQPQTVITAPVKDSSKIIDLASLFKKYFKKDTVPEAYPIFLAEALIDYESGNYATLQKLNLNDLPQVRGAGDNDRESILQLGHYYKGISYLETGNTEKAIAHFDWVLKNKPDKALQVKATWFLALAYLKENNREKAAALCRSIINKKGNSILIRNAEKILDTLGK